MNPALIMTNQNVVIAQVQVKRKSSIRVGYNKMTVQFDSG